MLETPRGTEGTAGPACSSARAEWGSTGLMLQDPPQRVLHLPLAPSQQLPTPQQHQRNCESRESNRISSSTAPQTGSRGKHRTSQQLHWGHGTKPPRGHSCAAPATNAGPEWGQQSCPCSSRAVPTRQQSCPHQAAAASSCQPPLPSAISHSHPAAEGTCPGPMELQGQLSPRQDSLQAQEEHPGALRDHHNSPWPSALPKGLPGSFGTFLPMLRQLWGRTQGQPPEQGLGHQQTNCRHIQHSSCPGCPRQELP